MFSKRTTKDSKPNPFAANKEDEYIGNMWGWRFSFFSLGIILLFFILFLIRQYQDSQLPVPQ